MFSDPQSVTVNSVAVSLPKISAGNMLGTYATPDGTYTLTISHANNKRERSMIRLDARKVSPSSIDPTKNQPFSASVYVVNDSPLNKQGFAQVDQENLLKALAAYLTPANITKFVGMES